MEDLSSMINQLLGSEDGLNRLSQAATALGLTPNNANTPPPDNSDTLHNNPPTEDKAASQQTQTPDLSAIISQLSSMIGSSQENAGVPEASVPETPVQTTEQSAPPDFANILSSLIGGLGGAQNTGNAPPPIDMNTIMTIQKAMGAMTQQDKNTDLLMALKPHFTLTRAKKVDDAIKILGLLKLLPLIKDSGLFGLGKEE